MTFQKRIGNLLARIGIKEFAVKVDLAIRARIRESISMFRHLFIPVLIKYRSAEGIFAVNIDSDWLGLGARIVKTLELLKFCDEKGFTPLIEYGYLEKTSGRKKYFQELFSWKQEHVITNQRVQFTKVRFIEELGLPEDYNKRLTLKEGKRLFDKYLDFNPEVVKEVDLFVELKFGNGPVLGVHYRGTDKQGEAPLLSPDQLLSYIKQVLKERKDIKSLFVSTDDQRILKFLEEASLNMPVFSRDDAVRSVDGDQFHRKENISKSAVNRDAIVNMLLLSRCTILLKTASILSDCSVIFNPDIDVRVMSVPHSDNLTWWPATEINRYALVSPESGYVVS